MKLAKELPSLETLNEWLNYEPETGELTWKKRRSTGGRIREVGDLATKVGPRGYHRVVIGGEYYQAHRVCWSIYHQDLLQPDEILDHVNGDRSDNRLCNLREVKLWENNHNRVTNSDVTGTHYYPHGENHWKASLKVNGMRHSLGCYATREEAVEARRAAEREHGLDVLRDVTRP